MNSYLPCGCSDSDFDFQKSEYMFELYIPKPDYKELLTIGNETIDEILFWYESGYSKVELSQLDIEGLENIDLFCLNRVQFNAVENILRQIREITEPDLN